MRILRAECGGCVRVSMTMAACAVWWVESGGARRAQHGTFQPGPPVSQLPAWCRHTAGKVLLANKFVFTLWGVTVRSYSEELYQYQSRTARSQSVSRQGGGRSCGPSWPAGLTSHNVLTLQSAWWGANCWVANQTFDFVFVLTFPNLLRSFDWLGNYPNIWLDF